MKSPALYFSAAYARLLVRESQSGTGICSPEALLAGTGLDRKALQDADYLDWPVIRRMLANIDRSGAPRAWPVQFARQLNLASHGPMGFTALSAPTLGDALRIMQSYHATRIATLKASLESVAGPAPRQLLVTRELTGDAVYGRQVLEIAVRVTLSLIEALVGHELGSNVQVHFAYPAPEAVGDFEQAMGVRCRFDAERNCIVIPNSWLYIASPMYDEATYHANLLKCREQMSSLLSIQANSVEWVRQQLAKIFDQALAEGRAPPSVPDLEYCAAQLHMATRTLSRKLAEQDTAFSKILAETRREYALRMLESSYLSASEIGTLLGYADPANFNRAFRQWCDCTPAQWRRSRNARQ